MVKVIFYTKNNERREALFNITEDDGLELYSLKTLDDRHSQEYKEFIAKKIPIVNKENKNINFIGIGDVIYWLTSKLQIKHCAKCNKRKECLNILTPIFISKMLTFFLNKINYYFYSSKKS